MDKNKSDDNLSEDHLKDFVKISNPSNQLDSIARLYSLFLGIEGPKEQKYWFRRNKVDIEKDKVDVVKDLMASGIDPSGFDVLISNELDRRLKERYGIIFLVLTVAFTLISYLIIIFNSIYEWGISDLAITVLLIEIPIQFIGLLYIIARNLFPQPKQEKKNLNEVDFGKFWNTVKITDNN